MMPDPLHPAVVHLPIALAVLVPLIAAGGVVAIAKRFVPARAWWVVVLFQLLLTGSAWLAVETGEAEEERVERVVNERHIEPHEQAAQRFLITAAVGAVFVAAGLLPNRLGGLGRVVGVLASLAVLAGAVSVGHSGGELVYRHGAATAYTSASPPPIEHEP